MQGILFELKLLNNLRVNTVKSVIGSKFLNMLLNMIFMLQICVSLCTFSGKNVVLNL